MATRAAAGACETYDISHDLSDTEESKSGAYQPVHIWPWMKSATVQPIPGRVLRFGPAAILPKNNDIGAGVLRKAPLARKLYSFFLHVMEVWTKRWLTQQSVPRQRGPVVF